MLLVTFAVACAKSRELGPPVITDVAVAAIDGREIDLRGRDFGSAGTLFVGTQGFASAGALQWKNGRILMPIPAGLAPGSLVHVSTARGTSGSVPLELWSLEEFEIPPTANTNALPLAIAVDSSSRVFANEEFHRVFQELVLGTAGAPPAVTPIERLDAPDPGPFAVYFDQFCLNGTCQDDFDQRTQTSVLGEDVLVDSLGRVWFTEGGGSLYEERDSARHPGTTVCVYPNHSRIVMLDPASGAQRVYDVPGDRNEVIGLAWDGVNVWFAEGGRQPGGKIASFDPERTPWDREEPTWDFSGPLIAHVNAPDGSGYQVRALPAGHEASYPVYPLVDPDGHVWFTTFLGNEIGRLDPATNEFELFPLAPIRAHRGPGSFFSTGGAGRLAFDADRSHVYVGESFDFEIDRVDAARVRAGDPACRAISDGRNPCIESIAVDDPNRFASRSYALLHSIAVEPTSGRIWFSEPAEPVVSSEDHLGYVTPDFAHVVRMSPLRRDTDADPSGPNGIAFDPRTGDLWFTEYFGKRLARLRRLRN